MKSVLVSSIQRYSLHNGQGIRTTVFFAGCPLRCEWCHNPECIPAQPVLLYNAEKCTHCGACARVCPSGAARMDEQHRLQFDHALCTACGLCVDSCLAGARELSAKPYSLQELVKVIVRDQPFFDESGGGVTLSGGEVMIQDADILDELLQTLYRRSIAVNIDTCGYAPWTRFKAVLPWVNTFMYDLKAFDSLLHKRLTGQDNRLILDNLKALSDSGARIDLRIPVIGGANDGLADWEAAADWLQQDIHVDEIHLLPYHNTGSGKYPRMGQEAVHFHVPAPETMRAIQSLFLLRGFSTPIIGG